MKIDSHIEGPRRIIGLQSIFGQNKPESRGQRTENREQRTENREQR